jgi:hypothetical protein
MLYKIRENVSIFEDNPELSAIPEFAKLTDRQMKFVCLFADRRSPLRTLPEKQRREKAAQIVGYPMEGSRLDRNGRDAVSGKVASIERAIEKYREYQHDENQATLDSTNTLIQTNKDFINSVNSRTDEEKKDKQYGKDLELANKFANQLPSLVESKQKLEALLNISIEQRPDITTYTSSDVEEGGQDLPAIELWHQSRQKQNND